MNIVSFINPTNLAQEKERFFASKTYHPQFEYDWQPEVVAAWVAKEPLYQDFVTAVQSQDHQQVLQAARKVFSTAMDNTVLAHAKEIVERTPETLPPVTIEEVVSLFTQAFEFFNLDYQLEVSDDHGFNFRPMHHQKKVLASKYLDLQFMSIDGEVKHELSHVLRYVNTVANNIAYVPNYLPTEEGLAIFFQDFRGEHASGSLFQHAAEYAMTEVALTSSLRETCEYLQEIGFGPELAWQRAVRHKYGFKDSSQPGDNMKPSMYFYWQQKIKKLSDAQKLRLMVGKISLNELENYPEYTGSIDTEKLAEFYKLEL